MVTVETSVTTTTTDSKGNKVTTVTNTQALFSAKKGHEGTFLGAQRTSYSITHNAQGAIVPGSLTGSRQGLTLAQATGVLGSKAIAAATEATAPGFGGELGRDIQAHPYIYGMHVAGFVLPFLGLPVEAEGIITAAEALETALDLKKESQ